MQNLAEKNNRVTDKPTNCAAKCITAPCLCCHRDQTPKTKEGGKIIDSQS